MTSSLSQAVICTGRLTNLYMRLTLGRYLNKCVCSVFHVSWGLSLPVSKPLRYNPDHQ